MLTFHTILEPEEHWSSRLWQILGVISVPEKSVMNKKSRLFVEWVER